MPRSQRPGASSSLSLVVNDRGVRVVEIGPHLSSVEVELERVPLNSAVPEGSAFNHQHYRERPKPRAASLSNPLSFPTAAVFSKQLLRKRGAGQLSEVPKPTFGAENLLMGNHDFQGKATSNGFASIILSASKPRRLPQKAS